MVIIWLYEIFQNSQNSILKRMDFECHSTINLHLQKGKPGYPLWLFQYPELTPAVMNSFHCFLWFCGTRGGFLEHCTCTASALSIATPYTSSSHFISPGFMVTICKKISFQGMVFSFKKIISSLQTENIYYVPKKRLDRKLTQKTHLSFLPFCLFVLFY